MVSAEAAPILPRVLVVDDDRAFGSMLADGLIERGYEALSLSSSQQAMARIAEPFDAVVTDLRMPGVDGLSLLAASRRLAPERPVLVMTAFSAVDSAVESIRQGAYHYLTKPFRVDELALFLERALSDARLRHEARLLRRTVREGGTLDAMVGTSAAMREIADLVRRLADADVPVLVLGETGTGKSLVARALHGESRREGQPFVTVNCAALPEALLESELFGHARGSFTGAVGDRRGLFQDAGAGTFFLDEIGELSLNLQAKLLDVLERGVVRPVGSNKEIRIDARIVAATHRDLEALVRRGEFREDLFFRLNVIAVEVPALRHRRGDLPALVDHFLQMARRTHASSVVERIAPDALACMQRHDWPGNTRELKHVIERLVLLATTPTVNVSDLPVDLRGVRGEDARTSFAGPVVPLADVSRRYAAWALEQMGGRKMMTTRALGIDPKTFSKLLGPAPPEEED